MSTTQVTCRCKQYDDGSRCWERACPDHGESYIMAQMLPVGTRIRSIRHPELTGYIKGIEWTGPGKVSPIPYLIGWDDSSRAADIRGWLFVYACVEDVERIDEDAA